jgi:hypothetical protein
MVWSSWKMSPSFVLAAEKQHNLIDCARFISIAILRRYWGVLGSMLNVKWIVEEKN